MWSKDHFCSLAIDTNGDNHDRELNDVESVRLLNTKKFGSLEF